MKRTHVHEYPWLYRHRGLFFWQRCECCRRDFRREGGFRYLTGPYYGGAGRWKYLCGECAPNRTVATGIIEGTSRRPVRPPPPPSPPRAR